MSTPVKPTEKKPVATATPAVKKPVSTPAATPQKALIKFQCKKCTFNIAREDNAELQRDCPKCGEKNPYVNPDQQKKLQTHTKLMSPTSKAQRVSKKTCDKSGEPVRVHLYELGSCIYCKRTEGSIEDPTTHVPGQFTKGDCLDGKKHMFKFSKCTVCGLSELEHIKQTNAAKKK